MNPHKTALRLVSRSRSLARPTVRLRLAAIYTGVFLVVGIALIAITYSLLSQQLNAFTPPWLRPPGTTTGQTWVVIVQDPGLKAQLNEVIAHQRAATLPHFSKVRLAELKANYAGTRL